MSGKKIKENIYEEDYNKVLNSEVDWTFYENSTIFVTGATGLIGSMLIKNIMYCNYRKGLQIKVVAACRNLVKAKQIFGKLVESKLLEIYIGDIISPIEYNKKIDYIFHTASITSSKEMIHYPVETIQTAYQGTYNILKLGVDNKVKGIVYLSSMEVYGNVNKESCYVHEKDLGIIDIGNVRSSYSEGKRICECMCTAFYTQYGLHVKIARLAQTFGVGVMKNDNRVYAQFARSIINKRNIVLHTDGESEGNYCYIADAIKALLILGYKGKEGEAYNVVNESTHMRIKDMAELVANLATVPTKIVYDIPMENKYGYAPPTKMKLSSEKIRQLGWSPSVNMEEAYRRMILDMISREENTVG